jgi:hypothetical protein
MVSDAISSKPLIRIGVVDAVGELFGFQFVKNFGFCGI